MKKIFTLLIVFLFAIAGSWAQTTTVKLYATDASAVGGIATSSQQLIGTGAWKNDQSKSKMELYLPLTSLGTFTIDDIASLQFSTKKSSPIPATPVLDFYWSIYTNGTKYSWYEERLTSEPIYYNGFVSLYDDWTTYKSTAGPNQMTFFDSHYGSLGWYGAPTLADLQAGSINWAAEGGTATTNIDYGTQTVKYISISTGSAWNATMVSYIDNIIINLNNGEKLIFDLEEKDPTPVTTIGNPIPSACGTLDIPVTVNDFTNVANVSVVLNYEAAVLEYQSVDINTELTGAFSFGAAGQFTLGRNSASDEITLDPGEVLFTLHFNILPAAIGGNTTNLTWDTEPGNNEYSSGGVIPTVYSGTFNDLTVTIPDRPVINTNTNLSYCSIQAAIDASETLNGHTIVVSAGIYKERVLINKELELRGPNFGIAGNSVSRNPEALVSFPYNMTGDWWAGVFDIQADNVTIDGFYVKDDGVSTSIEPEYFTGIHSGHYDANNLTFNNSVVKNNIIEGFNYCSILLQGGNTSMSGASGALVEYNYSFNCTDYTSIYMQNTGGTVQYNEVVNGPRAIQIQPYINTTGGTVSNNTLNAFATGIYFNYAMKGAAKWTIHDNTISASVAPIGVTNFTVDGAWQGISLRTFGTSGSGAMPEVEFYNISIDGSGASSANPFWSDVRGVEITNAVANADFHNNTIVNNETGVYIHDNCDVTNMIFSNNNISGNVNYGVENNSVTILDASPNWWGFASGPYNDPYNICGEGNEVSANVTFRQWWTNNLMNVLSSSTNPDIDIDADVAGTVECFDAATEPALPVVTDFCGTVLTPGEPLITNNITGCEGTRTYEYTYTDVLGGSLVWTYTYTIDHTTAPVVPANRASTVACLANAVPPLSVATCPSPYSVTPWPDYDCMFKTYMNSVLDQQQTGFASYVLDVNTGVGQSFTPAVSGLLTAIDVNIYGKTGTPSFILEIYAGGTKTGTPIYSSAGYTISGTGWISIPITGTQPTLVAGNQYTFWFTSYPYNSVRISIGNNVYNGGVCMDECAAYVVKDVCGNTIPTPTPVITDNYDGCEGTREYVYTYTDCAGLSSVWKYTYTIERNDFTMPANTTATVACVADVVVPTPPAVNYNCGNPITPVAGTTPSAPACEGEMVYTWTYTDCEGNTHPWTHTVIIDDNIAPTIITYPGAVTVNMNTGCTATGVELGMPTATDNCSGTVNFSNDAPTEYPEGETTVTWIAKDCANNQETFTQIVTVEKNVISGTLVYNNNAKTAIQNVQLILNPGGLTATTNASGAFSFAEICAGTYTIEVTANPWKEGGINSTDAGAVNYWSAFSSDIEAVKYLAGDVIADKFLSSDDALKIQRKFVFHEDFPIGTPAWSYWKAGELISDNTTPYDEGSADVNDHWPTAITVVVNDDIDDLELYGMATGDFNGSLVPTTLKSAYSSLVLDENSNLQIDANQAFGLPLRAASAMQVSAVSMILDIPSDLVTVQNVKINGSNDPVMWAINGNELRIGWHSLNPVNVAENGALVNLELIATDAFAEGRTMDITLPFNPLNELADGNFEAIESAELMVAKVGNQSVGNVTIDKNGGLLFSNYPNPFSKVTTLEYSLPVDGKVTINLYNNLGQLVAVLVDADQSAGQHMFRYENNTLQPGIYVAKLRLSASDADMVNTLKLSITK